MNWIQDVRFAFRMIAKNPWFSAAIVVTLALGMGINTTVFSLVNAALLKPLPFPGGDRLVMVGAANLPANRDFFPMSYADVRDMRAQAEAFDRLEAFARLGVNIGEHGNPPERFRGARITQGMLQMLSVKPILGRDFQPSDEKPGAEPVILLGYGPWKDRYGRDPNVVGRQVRANEKTAVIVGVLPEGFKFPNNEDVYMAASPTAEDERRDDRDFMLVGMTKPGVSPAEAQAGLMLTAKRLEQQFPKTHKDHTVAVRTFHQAMNGGPIRLVFLLMMGAVGFVLLIACANVANMLLSRAMTRSREVSIRAAMGASRWQIVRQMLVESVVLSAMGGALGLGIAYFGTRAFTNATADVGKPYWIDFSMNYTVFLYFAGLTIGAGLIFGLAPALRASRVNLNETLKEGSRGSEGPRGGYLSDALVVLQFTLAVVLLSGAGLMIRSFLVAQNEFANMLGDRVLTAGVSLPQSRYEEWDTRRRFFDKLMEEAAAIPGVETASMVSNLPGQGGSGWRTEIAGKLIAEERQRPMSTGIVAKPGYFGAVGLPLVRGRDFDESDGAPGKEAAIVSQKFASRHFPGKDPIGQEIRIYTNGNTPRPWMRIVGVAPDVRQNGPGDRAEDPVLFVPYRFEPYRFMTVLLRSRTAPATLTAALRAEVQEIDQDLPLNEPRVLQEQFERSRWYLRVFGTLFMTFALVALGMAAVGIYAVMAQAANRRTREIGVRMALGAGVNSILRLVLGRGMKQLAIGLVLGLAAGLAVCRLMGVILLGVAPNDPLTFISVAAVLCITGLIATGVPARRAARLDPVKALRYE
ncbi:MAG TPA: ABC transporter permease [Bryobacteraceae bacterium]|nr:ABC transporter permease [Bryobacteraceae bacterium]